MVQLRNCDSDPIAGLHPLHHTGQHFVASKSAWRMAHDFHQSTDPGCINSMAQARGTPRGRRGLSQCGNDRVRHVVMTDSRDGLPPLPVSDLSSSLHCIEPLLLPHPRFYQECWRQKGRQCHGCRLSSQPVTTIPPHLARHCPASSHHKQDDPAERVGPHTRRFPKTTHCLGNGPVWRLEGSRSVSATSTP